MTWIQAFAALYMSSARFWVITQHVVKFLTGVSGQLIGLILTFEDGTDRSSRNFGKELPLHAA